MQQELEEVRRRRRIWIRIFQIYCIIAIVALWVILFVFYHPKLIWDFSGVMFATLVLLAIIVLGQIVIRRFKAQAKK